MIARCSRALITSLCLASCVASTERVAAGRSGQQQVNVENIHVHRENERRPETSLSPPVSETPETTQGTVRNETTTNATKHPVLQSRVRIEPMTYLEGGRFQMGVNDPTSQTGEYPVRWAEVKPFKIDRYPVTNGDFKQFKRAKMKYRTTAERNNFSWVFFSHMSRAAKRVDNTFYTDAPWWYAVQAATWNKPNGVDRDIDSRLEFPVTHVSQHDAVAFCLWAGKRLPTEVEWEYASRGGLKNVRYPWGDRFEKKRANLWQGLFPLENPKVDGWEGLAPADAFFPQNNYGMYDMMGNAWEWTSKQYLGVKGSQPPKHKLYVAKGGSFVDSRDGRINLEARCAARFGLSPDYTAENVGFRCASSVDAPARPVPTPSPAPPRPVRVHTPQETWAYKVRQAIRKILGRRSGIYLPYRREEL
ncbi:Inactive C-alpha-formylglycine-generating enzyme 2 [Lamellibrachia satsuma]|nr:Inactive C-alpha-formylglycine-generating enzyme 2 [Lamellibrachia satsuma]